MGRQGAVVLFLLIMLVIAGIAHADDNMLYGSSTFCRVPRCDELSQENYQYIMNAEKLGLSDEQIRELREIKNECDREFILDKAKMRTARSELYELLDADEIDMKEVEKKSREVSELLSRIVLKRTKVKVQSMMILTAKQKKKAKELFMGQPPKK